MRKFLVFGAASAVGAVIGACGSSGDGGNPSTVPDGGSGASNGGSAGKNTGGSATGGRNGTTGGSAGTGGSSGTGGGDGSAGGGVRCGTAQCSPVAISPALSLDACCPSGASNRCGLDISSIASAFGISAGCVETSQPGTDDATCPATPASLPFEGGPGQFPGCCRPNGVCGVRIDLDAMAPGLDFGCASAAMLPEAGPPKACGQDASPDATTPDAAPEASTGGLPPGCPGVIGDYATIVSGTAGDDTFGDQSQKVVILGLAGNDTFNREIGESNCLVGGPGNDRFLYGAEGSEQTFVGGPGNDVFYIDQGPFGSKATIFDLNVQGDDEIHLNQTAFSLTGTPGGTASPTEVIAIPDHSGGGFPASAGAGARIGYDTTDGEIWADPDGSGQGISRLVGIVANHPAFDINDYKLE